MTREQIREEQEQVIEEILRRMWHCSAKIPCSQCPIEDLCKRWNELEGKLS